MSGTSPVARARRLLARHGGWIEATPGGYAVRLGASRRTRVMQTLDEAQFRALAADPGLKSRRGGGWTAATRPAAAEPPAPGRPGVAEGVVQVMEADGRMTAHRANVARSPVAWLAGRRDETGRPWLSRAQAAAAERLGLEAEAALRGPSLTMRWDALPRSGAGGSRRDGPGDRAMAASRRVDDALRACGPARGMVDMICIRATTLQAAEQDLGLRRRTGKTLLRQGLDALARHYGLG